MKNLAKAARLAALAFRNGLRLHRDSVTMYRVGSYPTALQLSILAQEEVGKALLLEEHVYQMGGRQSEITPAQERALVRDITSHRWKQTWFARRSLDTSTYLGKRIPRFFNEAVSGGLEERKQNATYVGLTKRSGEMDPNGRVVEPVARVRPGAVATYITRLNDYVLELAEGCRRGVYTVDTADVDDCLTMDLVVELEALWPTQSASTRRTLHRLRAHPLEDG